jgi:hypothetical protein
MEKLNKPKAIAKQNKRLNFLWGFIGTNRTGKSVTAVNYAEIYRQSKPENAIISFDPQKRFAHVSDRFIDPENKNWAVDLHAERNALVILDDYRLLNQGPTPVEGLAKLLYHRADWNLDIVYICHNPSLIINLLTYFTSHYFLFYTEATDGSFQKKIMNYKLCISGQKLINRYVKAYDRGAYPNFPFVMVDCENNKLNAFNFTKQKIK